MAHPKEETMSPPLPVYQGDGPEQGLFSKIKGLLPFHLWLMLPTIIVLAVITIYPFIWMVVMSFKETAMDPGEKDVWIGLYNYIRLLDDEPFLNGVKLLIWYFFLCLSIEMFVGMGVAMLINNAKFENVFIVIFVMPMMVAPIVVGYLFRFLYNVSFGWGYWFLKSTGLMGGETILANAKPWLLPFMPSTAFMAVVAADVWEWTPLIILIVLAGLKAVPQDQLEAARVDGAGPVRTFLEVTLPNIKGVLLIAVVVRFMDNVRLIDLIYVLTKGGPADTTKILPFYLYNVSFRYFEFGRGAAIGFILLLFTILMGMFFVNVVFKKKEVGNNG
jgi:multiple sugar transport system permease protein